jgi:hypothetical protein
MNFCLATSACLSGEAFLNESSFLTDIRRGRGRIRGLDSAPAGQKRGSAIPATPFTDPDFGFAAQIPALTRHRGRISPLFNMIPVGSKPVAAAVLPI